MPAVFDALCARLVADAGVPLWRASLNVLTLHPLILGHSRRWWRARPAETEAWAHGAEREDGYLKGPLHPVVERGETVRRRLEGAAPAGMPLLEAFRRDGA